MLNRIYFIDKEIASGKYPNTRTLAETYETSIPTISRDIEHMKDIMNAPIEYDFTRKGYYYSEKTFRLPAAIATADDMLAIGMAKNLLSLYKSTPMYDAALQFLESITSPLREKESSGLFDDRIIVPPIPSVQFDSDVWDCICEGLKKIAPLVLNIAAPGKAAIPRAMFIRISFYLITAHGTCTPIQKKAKANPHRRTRDSRLPSA